MKNLNWLWVIIVPLIAVIAPNYADLPEAVSNGLLTPVGYIGLITLVTQVFKPLVFKIDFFYNWKHTSVFLSLVVALVLGVGAWFFQYGIFAGMVLIEVLGHAVIAWGAANKWYDWTLKES